MTQYSSHVGPKKGHKLVHVTNIYDAKWQSSWAQDGMQVGLARTIEFGSQATPGGNIVNKLGLAGVSLAQFGLV